MQHEWIVREIEDLMQAAQDCGLTALAEFLKEGRDLAMVEIANLGEDSPAR